MNRLLLPLLALGAHACAPMSQIPSCTPKSVCRLDGPLTFDRRSSTLQIELPIGSCRLFTRYSDRVPATDRACSPEAHKDWSQVKLVTPWGEELPVAAAGADYIQFRIDWTHADVDPLSPRVDEQLERGWTVVARDIDQQRVWFPDASERAGMLPLIAEATHTETRVAEVTAAPVLSVQDFHNEGELRNGNSAELVLTVANGGEGTAYRVVVITRSNVPALHGVQFSFGQLAPGQAKTRRVKVGVPRENDETEAMIVLVFEEAHQFTPQPPSKKFAVRPALDAPRLSMACKLAGDGSPRPRVDAGQILRVVCEVRNDGPRARGVKVTARLGDNPPVAAAPFDLDSEKSTSVSLALQVPKAAVLDSELTLNVHASAGGGSGAEVDVTLALLVSRPKICPEGKLSRDKFNTKRIALRKKLDEGLISQEEHDKYYAELVECLE